MHYMEENGRVALDRVKVDLSLISNSESLKRNSKTLSVLSHPNLKANSNA
jgi:hypothetical protein